MPEPEIRAKQFPHQLSGGLRQRVMIAMALAGHPKVLIADEPTTALDVTVQLQILELLDRLRREMDLGLLFITHDLGVVAKVAERIAVMYAGRIIEEGATTDVLTSPRHPYTQGLLALPPRCAAPNFDRFRAPCHNSQRFRLVVLRTALSVSSRGVRSRDAGPAGREAGAICPVCAGMNPPGTNFLEVCNLRKTYPRPAAVFGPTGSSEFYRGGGRELHCGGRRNVRDRWGKRLRKNDAGADAAASDRTRQRPNLP